MSPTARPPIAPKIAALEGGVEERARRSPDVGVDVPQDQQEERVHDRVEQPEQDAQLRVVAVGARADHARDQHDAAEHDRHGDQRAVLGALAERRPGEQRDEDDLDVAEHRGQPGADRLDGVVPESQVGGEQHPREPAEQVVAPRAAAEALALAPGEQSQQRQRVEAAKERGRRGRDLGELHQNRGPGDDQRAEGAGENRSIAHEHRDYSAGSGSGIRAPAPSAAPRRRGCPECKTDIVRQVSRNTALWTLVIFFGATIMFGYIRNATEDESTATSLAAQGSRGCCSSP